MHGEQSALKNFIEIMFLPDNIPIVGMLFLVMFFTYLGFREARKHDQLVLEGRGDEILKEMQK